MLRGDHNKADLRTCIPFAHLVLRRLGTQAVVQGCARVGNLADEASRGVQVHTSQRCGDVAVVDLGQRSALFVVAVGTVEQQGQVQQFAHSLDVCGIQALEVDLDARLEEQTLSQGLEQGHTGLGCVDGCVDLGVWVKPGADGGPASTVCDHFVATQTCDTATAGRRS